MLSAANVSAYNAPKMLLDTRVFNYSCYFFSNGNMNKHGYSENRLGTFLSEMIFDDSTRSQYGTTLHSFDTINTRFAAKAEFILNFT